MLIEMPGFCDNGDETSASVLGVLFWSGSYLRRLSASKPAIQ